jgi:inosine-uridine nucleoside N-ribohydrolase
MDFIRNALDGKQPQNLIIDTDAESDDVLVLLLTELLMTLGAINQLIICTSMGDPMIKIRYANMIAGLGGMKDRIRFVAGSSGIKEEYIPADLNFPDVTNIITMEEIDGFLTAPAHVLIIATPTNTMALSKILPASKIIGYHFMGGWYLSKTTSSQIGLAPYLSNTTSSQVGLAPYLSNTTSSQVGLAPYLSNTTSSQVGLAPYLSNTTFSQVGLAPYLSNTTFSQVGLAPYLSNTTSSQVGLSPYEPQLKADSETSFNVRMNPACAQEMFDTLRPLRIYPSWVYRKHIGMVNSQTYPQIYSAIMAHPDGRIRFALKLWDFHITQYMTNFCIVSKDQIAKQFTPADVVSFIGLFFTDSFIPKGCIEYVSEIAVRVEGEKSYISTTPSIDPTDPANISVVTNVNKEVFVTIMMELLGQINHEIDPYYVEYVTKMENECRQKSPIKDIPPI